MAGGAIAKLLSGDVNPSGHLTMSFPYSIGQIPIYYNVLNTGRPTFKGSSEHFESKYLDGPVDPLYAFGYGKSYSDFVISNLSLPDSLKVSDETIEVSVDVENKSSVSGVALIQLYIRDKVASIARPKKELKGFRRVHLGAGEKKSVSFSLDINQMGFYDSDYTYHVELGEYDIFVGLSSRDEDLMKKSIRLTK